MALFFKGGEQLYTEAMDAIGRKDYQAAKKKFLDAKEKGYDRDGLGMVYVAIIDIGSARKNVGAYNRLADMLRNLQVSNIKFGLTEMDVSDLITECELAVKEIEASGLSNSDYNNKGNALIAVAGGYMSRIGEKNLKFDEIFKGNTVSNGNREALILQAQAYRIMGEGCVHTDPKMAADYMQMAYNFRRQLGDSGDEELRLSRNYARSAKCWICGRPANGEGIHFERMRADIEPVFDKMASEEAIRPVSDDVSSIYVCMPCFTAISNRSDEIANEYYQQALAEMRAMEMRLQAEINSVRFSASMHR